MILTNGVLRRIGELALVIALGACAPKQVVLGQSAVQGWASSADASRKLTPIQGLQLELGVTVSSDPAMIVIEQDRPQQAIVGFGAAMTDSSAYLFERVLDPAERDTLFAELFGEGGLRLNFVRVPIGASDFSITHYSLDDVPPDQSDPQLAHFSMALAEAAQIPALKAARRANPNMVLMATPWSAPGWMKDTGSLITGRLQPQFYPAFAAYFARYLDAMEGEGLAVRYLSVQNEPRFEPKNYPGMAFPARERAQFIGQHLGPLLAARRNTVEILDWDHNWDHPEEPLAVLADPQAARYVAGIAWHCYAGDPSAMQPVHDAHPAKDVFVTECSGGEWGPHWGETLGWMIDRLIIEPTRAGSRGTMLWNLALDEKYGPHLGGCSDCRGVVTIESKAHGVTRNVEYYVLGHVSRFVQPGAHRLPSRGGSGTVSHVAFRNPDGTLVLLLHNRGPNPAAQVVAAGRKTVRLDLPAGEVVTLTWRRQ
ncbi:MAG: hypothetical protein RIQ99_97 [Pseudomonadota bacterium]|jgi:glucosylceramidase